MAGEGEGGNMEEDGAIFLPCCCGNMEEDQGCLSDGHHIRLRNASVNAGVVRLRDCS